MLANASASPNPIWFPHPYAMRAPRETPDADPPPVPGPDVYPPVKPSNPVTEPEPDQPITDPPVRPQKDPEPLPA